MSRVRRLMAFQTSPGGIVIVSNLAMTVQNCYTPRAWCGWKCRNQKTSVFHQVIRRKLARILPSSLEKSPWVLKRVVLSGAPPSHPCSCVLALPASFSSDPGMLALCAVKGWHECLEPRGSWLYSPWWWTPLFSQFYLSCPLLFLGITVDSQNC